MTPEERNWMASLLGVQAPWQVLDVRIGLAERMATVHIGPAPEPTSRFWALRKPTAAAVVGRRLRWNHLPLAGMPCEVLLTLPEGQSPPDAAWSGDPNLPFTHGLSRLVLDLMLEGASMSHLCLLLDLPLGDLWKYKFRLDQGSARAPRLPVQEGRTPGPSPAPPPAAAAEAIPPATPPADRPAGLPPEEAPVWLAILKGRLTLDVQALSLKLLLSKLMREAQSHQDPDLHRQAGQSLRRYFARNQALLGHEIQQIMAATQKSPSHQDALPDVSDPLWAELLTGERELDVRTLSLRLLLTKLRQQARGLQDDEVRMLQLVDLHRFFEKHHAVLRHEIAQLKHWSVH